MRLLFDQNLSPRLPGQLADLYPNAQHVSLVGMGSASDEAVWEYARATDCIIVTKDVDFGDFSAIWGFPPKVVWLRLGNCTTAHIETILRAHFEAIEALATDATVGLLTLI